jgi:hypothetical protein
VPEASTKQIREETRRLFNILNPRGYLFLIGEGSQGVRMPRLADLSDNAGLPAASGGNPGQIPDALLKRP